MGSINPPKDRNYSGKTRIDMTQSSQVAYWKDDLALFSHAVEALPHSPLAHNGLAAALAQKGDLEGSERELRAVLRLKPDFMFVRVSLGNLLTRMGRSAEVDRGSRPLYSISRRSASRLGWCVMSRCTGVIET